MRAREFITEEKSNGIDLSMEIQKDDEYMDDDDYSNQILFVKASAGGKELGYVIFAFDGEYLLPQDLEVEERFRGQGIAQTMYDYVKSKGYKIRRSGQQTDAGAGFWAKHRPEQNVWEAFDQPYKTKTEKSEYGDVDMLARLPDGTNLSIMFNNQGDDEWQVEFYRNNSQEVTGEGDAQRVFATVLTSMQKFIKKYKPWRLTFSATKDVEPGKNSESRAKLYNRLVQRYATAWGYEEYAEDHGDQITYELTRLKPSVAEGQDKAQAVRRIQKMLNDRFDANLDVDGVLGPLTQKSINRFMPSARPAAADDPSRTTAVQGRQTKQSEEEQLDELSFLGSQCTKDCSGHRAGYEWSKRKGLRQANSWSPSFNKGAGLAVAGK